MSKCEVSVEQAEDGKVRLSVKDDEHNFTIFLDDDAACDAGIKLLMAGARPNPTPPRSIMDEDPMLWLVHPTMLIGSYGEDAMVACQVSNHRPVFVVLNDDQANHLLRDLQSVLDIPRSMRSQPKRH